MCSNMILPALIRRAFASPLLPSDLYKSFHCFKNNNRCVACLCCSAFFILQSPLRSVQSIWGCVGVSLSECFHAVHTYPGKAYSHLYHNVTSTRYQFKKIKSALSSVKSRKVNIFATYNQWYHTPSTYVPFVFPGRNHLVPGIKQH